MRKLTPMSFVILLSFMYIEILSADTNEIETKYLMFRVPKVRFDDILQLKKPGGKLDFGDGIVLSHDDIDTITSDPPKNFTYKVTLKKPLRFSNVTIHSNCILEFSAFKGKKSNRYLLNVVDCRSGSAEIERIKLKAQFHSTFAKDEFHFAAMPVTSLTEVPLVDGKKVAPDKTIWIDDFDPDKDTTPISGVSN